MQTRLNKLLVMALAAAAALFTAEAADAAQTSPSAVHSLVNTVSSPSGPQAGPYRIVNEASGWCLDANWNLDVYTLPCTSNNQYQQWEFWYGGWTRHVRTGHCLTADISGRVRLAQCRVSSPARWQLWYQWHGGWYKNDWYGTCLTGTTVDSTVRNYSCATNRRQYWYHFSPL
ncbi:MAG TPA: hypothetical protein DGG94_12675 [Micromonosporaceae bacterium]|nr:hypothetical protein [Micromonosporaceae bacterium]HCU50633.1 hypothetical protein [Micromonosporaceae bacterium]